MKVVALILMLLATATGVRAAIPHISLDVRDADMADVFALLAEEGGRNIVADASLPQQKLTLRMRDVTFDQALDAILNANGLQVHREGRIYIVGAAASMNRRYPGVADSRSAQTVVVHLVNAAPEDVAKSLVGALPEGTVVVPDARTSSLIATGSAATVARVRVLVRALDATSAGDAGSARNRAIHLRFLKASDAVKALKGTLPDGSYVADDGQNAVVVSGGPDRQQSAKQFLDSLDVAPAQVAFEVRVADLVPVNDASNVGVEFGGFDLGGTPTLGGAAYAFAKNSLQINARLNALVTRGRAQILATPKLVTVNNREASMLIGETYPVVYYDARIGGTQVQFVDVGVKLRLTPTVGSDGSVTAELHPEYSAIEGFVGGYPVLANRKIDSTLRVRDNETIVIGGLLRETDSETVTKIPGLAEIPILGKIFANRQRSHERDDIVFLLTPHVLYPQSAAPGGR